MTLFAALGGVHPYITSMTLSKHSLQPLSP